MGWHWGVLASSGGGAAGAYELISTTVLSTATSSVTFSSIPSTYKHLQIRMVVADGDGSSMTGITTRFNSDTGTNYRFHRLYGTGSAVASGADDGTYSYLFWQQTMEGALTNAFTANIIDILDYSSTVKFKTARLFGGFTNSSSGNHRINLSSGLWRSTSAISSITFEPQNMDGSPIFRANSRFSLYGVKG